jgi:hypothetical protein
MDERGEWQTEGVVRHRTGRIRIENGLVIVTTSGVSGWIRRTRWTKDESFALESVASVTVVERRRTPCDLMLAVNSAEGRVEIVLLDCRPPEALSSLLRTLRLEVPNVAISGWP